MKIEDIAKELNRTTSAIKARIYILKKKQKEN
jgi:hypothetical protein